MLTAETIRIVKSTAPILAERGAEITGHFYKRMFSRHPELLNIFNHANQKQGRQQQALAHTVWAAAANIDNLGSLLPVVKQIAHKHRALGVKPEHYPIVGENLLGAISEVLGAAATPEVLAAWGEAYGVIAQVFIDVEAEMYREAAAPTGGWDGFREFAVVRKVQESEEIVSFYLQPQDGGPLPQYAPGQYVTVRTANAHPEHVQMRHYSLSDAPGKSYLRITVKREAALAERPAGVVSNYLHDGVQEGDQLLLSAPAGDFTLDEQDTRRAVFLSGGVGQTPLLSMLAVSVERQPSRPVAWLHAARNERVRAMNEAVADVISGHGDAIVQTWYEETTGRIDLAALQETLPDRNNQYYVCGPLPFMRAVYKALREWGVPAEDIRYELFGPHASLEEPVLVKS